MKGALFRVTSAKKWKQKSKVIRKFIVITVIAKEELDCIQ